MPTKLITVFGATGSQGGSVLNSLLKNNSGTFSLRGITRNVESEGSKALVARGVEMRQASCLAKDQILHALRGSWGVFVNTNSEDPAVTKPDGPSDTDVGKTIVDAAVESGVKHFVYSGLASASKITNGAVSCKMFDEKYAVGEYAKSKDFDSVAIVSAGWYMENFLNEHLSRIGGGFPLYTDEEGYLTFRFPQWGGQGEIPFIAIEDDYGDLVHGVFLDPKRYNGKFIHGMSHAATPVQAVESFEKVTGKKSRFISIEDWKDFGKHDQSLEAIRNMFGFCQLSGGLYFGKPNDPSLPRELKAAAAKAQGRSSGELTTVERFIDQHFAP